MSRRNKLAKFAELLTFPNVYENFDTQRPELAGQHGAIVDLKGRWNEDHFQNEQPITLELACGRGEYSLGLGRMYPERNFIGVDIKGARIWKGAKIALAESLDNVAFLRTRIEILDAFFAEAEVDEIWITFPDPFLGNKKINRRLTSPNFLDIYKRVLSPKGLIHLKTDEIQLHDYTMEVLRERDDIEILYADDDIYGKELYLPELGLKTYYENLNISDSDTIKYIQFRFRPDSGKAAD
ncbi:tRNA (guanosine(46)-N7)-methyltransferase TrmB [Flavilitoribacter nigricans]|uniref:tRNA (guanine-N(7)-)-methyltransferase n=1 Tax=Flavilitoribacter nigricans (strain ATCC 23147 / DSM 23189 / NBRC 102662 / NCIMB 1420 / SS-2) TaxID=1122177 RepID=A0A2D0N705_FLAN2|nr:tRNA (guanosine(46)-N7)-methyltransferase TrmB [Flavilitoribacter nigricans]PHN04247.1 tRNA (guanosine(46)-N7)-methyltransferase TrmB [Flavilitoribacter nigricans DSM 23189 = NBRC 102662]